MPEEGDRQGRPSTGDQTHWTRGVAEIDRQRLEAGRIRQPSPTGEEPGEVASIRQGASQPGARGLGRIGGEARLERLVQGTSQGGPGSRNGSSTLPGERIGRRAEASRIEARGGVVVAGQGPDQLRLPRGQPLPLLRRHGPSSDRCPA